MKVLDLIIAIKSNTNYTKNDEWKEFINGIKKNKKLQKELLSSINPILGSNNNLSKKDIENILKGL